MTVFVIAFILGALVGGAFVHFTMLAPLQKEQAGKRAGDTGSPAAEGVGNQRVAVKEVGELLRFEPGHEVLFTAVHSQYEPLYEVQVRENGGVKEQLWLSGKELMEFRKILDARDDWAKPQTTA